MLNYLFRVMQIDEAWSVWEANGFTWWGYNLAQRVWAEPPVETDGGRVVSFRVQTDVFREVSDVDAIAGAIDAWNRHTTLSGLVIDKAQGTVKLCCSMACDEENVRKLRGLLAVAMAIQCADAHALAAQAAGRLGCKPDTSCHPRNGPRPTPDEMLTIREDLMLRGAEPAPFREEDFRSAAAILEALLRKDRGGAVPMRIEGPNLLVELPFWADIPVAEQMRVHGKVIQIVTSCVLASAQVRHPWWGSGLQLLLRLPLFAAHAEAHLKLVQVLNFGEAAFRNWFSQLGAWCLDRETNGICFYCFVPTAIAQPHQLPWLTQHMVYRSFWARDLLTKCLRDRFELAPELLEMLPA